MNNGTGLFVTVCGTVPYGERSIEEFVANLAVRGCESPADIIWEILEEKGPEEIGRYTGMTLRVYRIILEVLSELQDED
jgi:hypothetical protein